MRTLSQLFGMQHVGEWVWQPSNSHCVDAGRPLTACMVTEERYVATVVYSSTLFIRKNGHREQPCFTLPSPFLSIELDEKQRLYTRTKLSQQRLNAAAPHK